MIPALQLETIEIDGVIIFKREIKNYNSNRSAVLDDYELSMFLNHVHILDEIENDAELDLEPWYDFDHPDFAKAWELAKELVDYYKKILKQKYPTQQFELLATKFDNPIFRFSKVTDKENLVEHGPDFYRVIE